MKLSTSLLLGMLVLFLASCGKQPFYEKAYSFSGREWKQDVKPKYEVVFTTIDPLYDFTVSLRTSTDYKYSNLWIFMKTETPDGTIAREPFEIQITNPDGSWIGEKSGSIWRGYIPVNFIDWDSDFFPALSLGLFFALSTAIF